MGVRERTKIVATIGPSCQSVEMMSRLIEEGMRVARLNFSHGTHEDHLVSINNLKEARAKAGISVAIMLDTKGPEIRVGKVQTAFAVKQGDRIELHRQEMVGGAGKIHIGPEIVFDHLKPGMPLLIDNGYVNTKVVEITAFGAVVEAENIGTISSNKGVNLPGQEINLPAVTEKDISDITFGLKNGVDIIAASFVRSKKEVEVIRKICQDAGQSDAFIIAKIENHQGVDAFDEIVQVADGIMVARGDLGVELPLAVIPRLQKMMIRRCYLAAKPVITATQMLESMITSPRPTRAEVSDVANAIYDSTSAVMLSGETAIGKYPIETVEVMRRIAEEAENDFKYRDFFFSNARRVYNDIPASVTLAVVNTAYCANAKAILAFSSSGMTARLISSLRPEIPVIVMTDNERSYHQMALFWGVTPVFCRDAKNNDDAFVRLCAFAKQQGIVAAGDLVVVAAGTPFGQMGATNMMLVEKVV